MDSDVLHEVVELIYGGGGSDIVAKMEPTQSDLATHERRKRAFTAGLSAVGATAGAAGLALGGHNLTRSYKLARFGAYGGKAAREAKHAAVATKPIATRLGAAKSAVKGEKLATGLLPLEVAGLGGEVMSTKILHNDSKQQKVSSSTAPKTIGKRLRDKKIPTTRGTLMTVATNPTVQRKGIEYTKTSTGILRRLPNKVLSSNDSVDDVIKRDVDVIWAGEFAKADADKQQVFGWASVVEVNGEPVVDLQGDYISPEEMEKAAYTYVTKSRKGGDMHLRNNWEPIQKSEMIESFIVTPEKREAMGLPDSIPTGWWVGFQVQDPEVWADIRAKKRTGFSIHGMGKRTPA